MLEVKVEGEYYHVSYGFHQFAWFHKNDEVGKRVTVVQLVNMGVSKAQLSRVFDVNRSSVYFWKEKYEEEGFEGVVSLAKGPDSKLTEAVKDYIYALYKKLRGERSFRKKISEEVKKLYGVEVSREGIRRVVKERLTNDEPEVCSEEAEPEGVVEKNPVVVKHGGSLLSLALLGKYGVEDLLVNGVESREGMYGFKECVLSLLLLLGPRLLKVEENLKHYDDEMTGGLIGRGRLPSVKTVRRVIAEGCAQIGGDVERMKSEYARGCLDVWGYEGPFYLDGHFMPYTGGERILYGYNPQRRLAEKGRTAYVVNTGGGRPIYEVLSDGFDDFRVNIEKIVDFLIEEAGVERPTVIFDRGGFSWESFEKIEGKADFICWYEGKVSIPRGKWKEVRVPHASNTYGEVEYVRQEYKEQVIAEGDENGQGYRRMVFIKKGEKVSPAITNIRQSPGKEVLLQLTRRWGAQENIFKELVIDGYDKIHSYRKDEYNDMYFESEEIDRNRMMENPEWRKLLVEKRRLQNKRDVTLGRIAKKEKESEKPIKATKQQQERLDVIENRICEITKRLAYLPEKVLRIDYIHGSGLVRLANEKKKYFDLLNLIAYNMRQDMVEIIGPVYRNNRDAHQLVLKILRLMTTIEYGGSQTKVIFTQKLKGKERESLDELCRVADSMGHETELFPGKLAFSVQ
jgi:transposase